MSGIGGQGSRIPRSTREACFFFSRGNCKYGDACKYAHVQPNQAPQATGNTNATSGRKRADRAKSLGRPTYLSIATKPDLSAEAPSVASVNETSEVAAIPSNASSSSAQPKEIQGNGVPLSGNVQVSKRSNKPCFAWRNGHCPKGERCQFNHDPKIQAIERRRKEVFENAKKRAEQQALKEKEEAEFKERQLREAEAAESQRREAEAAERQLREAEEKRKEDLERIAREEAATRQRAQETLEAALEAARKAREAAKAKREEQARKRREREEKLARETAERQRREAEARERQLREAERMERELREAEEKRKEELERIAREEAAARQRAQEVREAARKAREAAKAKKEEQARKRREREEKLAREAKEREDTARQRAREELEVRQRQEAAFTLQLVVNGSNLVTFEAGVNIKNVIGGFELCKITVKNLPLNARLDEVADLFVHQGLDASQFHVQGLRREGNNQEAYVLTRAEEGEAITVGLEGIEFRDRTLEFECSVNASWGSMDTSSPHNANVLSVFWNAPSTCMVANYSTMEEARAKARELDQTMYGGRRIKAMMNTAPTGPAARYFIPSSVKLMGLPQEASFIEVQYVSGAMSMKELKSFKYNLQDCFRTLEQRLEACNLIRGSFSILTPNPIDGNVRVKAEFLSHEDAQRAFQSVNDHRIGGSPPLRASLPKPHQFIITIPRQQYEAQRKHWNSLAEGKRRDQGAFIQVNEGTYNRMFIKVLGSDQKEVGGLKVRVESLVAGERLDINHWHTSFFSVPGGRFLNSVNSTTGAYVRLDRKIQALRLHADNEKVEAAKEMIRGEVERLNALEWTVPLKRQSVGFFVRTGLKALKEVFGEDNVSLDLASNPCMLKIKGGDDARHHLGKLMDESILAFRPEPPQQEEEGETCPICTEEVSHPEILTCGHSCCQACLRHYLTSAPDSKNFPLVCMGNDATCNTPIAIPIIQRFLTRQRFDQLIEVAFQTHLERNPRKFKYCTTPDCTQIYQSDTDKAVLQCPSCFSKICPACNEEAHEGMTCEERRIHTNPEEQERLNDEWAASNGVKKCPACSVMIMKSEGCNHMECRCGAHICWRCMGLFTADTIYAHLNSAHGGIHGEDPVPLPNVARQADEPVPNWGGIGRGFWDDDDMGNQYERYLQLQQEAAARRRLEEAERAAEAMRLEEAARAARARMWLVQREREREREGEALRLAERAEATNRQIAMERYRRRLQDEEAARKAAENRRGGMCVIM